MSSSASSWTGIIVGATIGAVAIIGTGYLAYRKWRGHGKGIAPQTKGAAIAAMNAMDSAREGDEGRIQTNPVYEENHLQQAAGIYERAQVNPAYEDVSRQALRAYEVPHIDTWDRQAYDAVEQNDGVSITKLAAKTIRAAYDTILPPENSELLTSQNTAYYDIAEPEEQMVHQIMRTTYDVLDVTMESRRAYEAPHVTTWSPQSYDFVDGSYRPPAYEIVLAPQKPWNSEGYETGPFSVSDL